MCGLVGCAGPITAKHEKVFKDMLIFDSVRGAHSTGVAVVRRHVEEVMLAKQVGNPYELMDTPKFEALFRGINKVVIGHNRWATQGKVNKFNAHPYEFDSVVGAHNGTLLNRHTLFEYGLHDVDSQNLYHHLDKRGLKDLLTKLDGAWALTWYNKDEDTLNFLRNRERPLHLAVSEDSVLFWASEPWMLEAAMWRNNMKHDEIYELPVDKHMVFTFDGNGKLEKPHLFNAPSTVVKTVFNNYNNHQGPKGNGVGATNTTPVQSGGKVIDMVKKQEDEAKKPPVVTQNTSAQHPGLKPYLLGQKVSLTVGQLDTDSSGNLFYECFDVKNIHLKIRLYKKRGDVMALVGKQIEAEMHQFMYSDRKGLYYKVEHGTVRLAKPDPEVQEVEVEEVADEGRYFQDARGRLIPKEDWETKYGVCAYCTGFVNPEQAFRFTTEGEALCHVCAEDPIVHQYVNLK